MAIMRAFPRIRRPEAGRRLSVAELIFLRTVSIEELGLPCSIVYEPVVVVQGSVRRCSLLVVSSYEAGIDFHPCWSQAARPARLGHSLAP